MKDKKRRIENLEQTAATSTPAPPVESGDLAAGLMDAWQAIDNGTFTGTEYHERALVTLREALETMGGR